jgi:NADPH:quinone reductase and related Zn-dependent oxidoreductases
LVSPREGQIVADLCVVGGYAQYAIRPARFLVPFQMARCGRGRLHTARLPYSLPDAHALSSLVPGETILVIGASGTVGTAMLDLARHFGLKAIGTCSAANLAS